MVGDARGERVEDRQGLLTQDDHMRDMERIEMEVERIFRPTPTVARVIARIAPRNPEAWRRANLAMRIEVEQPEGGRPVSRVYTVRSFDPERSSIEIDFVVHPDDSPAMRWLAQARPGTRTWFVGPRPHFLPDYESGRRIAIFADETAIPAVYAILNAWQQPARGVVYIETTDRAAFEELPQVLGVESHLFLRRADEQPGKTSYLLDAAQALPDPASWRVWAAGEREVARAIRAYFEGHGLGRDEVRVFGYWRNGVSSSQIDRARLGHYADMRTRKEGLERFEDLDLPV